VTAWAQRYDDHIELHFRYDREALAALKSQVPGSAREWDPDEKLWIVHEPYVDRILATLRDFVGMVEVADLRRPGRRPGPVADWASALFNALPDHLRQPAFRALSKVLHPDIGGDPRLAQQLNDAFVNRKVS
jgi:hypothetical protein